MKLIQTFTFAFVILISSAYASSTQKSQEITEDEDIPAYYGDDMDGFLHQLCLEKKHISACEMTQASLWGQERRLEAREIAEILCKKRPGVRCGDIYYLSQDISEKEAEQALKKLEALCDADIRTCDALAHIYDGRNESAPALKYAKKYYDKMKTGFYTWLAYKYNADKKLAFKESLKNCREDGSSCLFTLRYMPDHPQRSEIVDRSTKSCEQSQPHSASGATDCTIVGSYFYKINQFDKAYKMWRHDCAWNPMSCELILGGIQFSRQQHLQAARDFCAPKEMSGHFSQVEMHSTYCPAARVPASKGEELLVLKLQNEGLKLLRSFVKEQK